MQTLCVGRLVGGSEFGIEFGMGGKYEAGSNSYIIQQLKTFFPYLFKILSELICLLVLIKLIN